MVINQHTGIERQLIEAINAAYADGDLPTIKSIELTRAEMDEFIKNNPFTGNTGKFYGDDDKHSLLEIRTAYGDPKDGLKVQSFVLRGILVYVPEGQ